MRDAEDGRRFAWPAGAHQVDAPQQNRRAENDQRDCDDVTATHLCPLPPLDRDAEWAGGLCELVPRADPARRAFLNVSGVDHERVSLDRDRETVEPAWGGSSVVLAVETVLRAVT